MESGIDAGLPVWAQSALAIGGVAAAMLAALWRGLRNAPNAAPEIAVMGTRNDFMDVFVREQRENREVLLRIAASSEAMERIMQTEASDARAQEIAERVMRGKRRADEEEADRAK
jgi:hypothetical protein